MQFPVTFTVTLTSAEPNTPSTKAPSDSRICFSQSHPAVLVANTYLLLWLFAASTVLDSADSRAGAMGRGSSMTRRPYWNVNHSLYGCIPATLGRNRYWRLSPGA